jgi:hypothetical protein
MSNAIDDLCRTYFRASFRILGVATAFALSGCGGGGGAPTGGAGASGGPISSVEDMDGSGDTQNVYTQFAATTAGATSTFRTVAINNAFGVADPIVGTFDHATGEVTDGTLAGTFNAQRTILELLSGESVTVSDIAATEYVRFFQTSGTGDNLFGVVGQASFAADLPTDGDAVYNGVVVMDVNNPDGRYNLTGDARVTVNWGNDVDTLFLNLSGRLNDGPNQSVNGTIEIAGASLNGSSFAAGELNRTGTIFSRFGTVDRSFQGQFYGRNGDEVGGVFTLTSVPDELNISAVFAAE